MNVRTAHRFTSLLASLFVMLVLLGVTAQDATAQDGPGFSQQELDQMMAPIALYPDGLLSQILMAATYPQEVEEAARWSAANPHLAAQRAVQAVAQKNWDPSVMSLTAFPQILGMMGSRISWTRRLGDAFLGQQEEVMNTVQALRQRAYLAGNLRSNGYARIDNQGDVISIFPTQPGMVYTPYYNAAVVYGSWWWPMFPPVYWAPWPGHVERPGYGNAILWGVGLSLGAQFFFGDFDWRQHRTRVISVQNNYYPRQAPAHRPVDGSWQHDPQHRRGTPYQGAAVRERFPLAAPPVPARTPFRGHPAPAIMAPTPAHVTPTPARVTPTPARVTPTPQRPPPPEAPPRTHALENIDHPAAARDASARGRSSREATGPANTRGPAAAPAAPKPGPREKTSSRKDREKEQRDR